jgi:hypothetical protein
VFASREAPFQPLPEDQPQPNSTTMNENTNEWTPASIPPPEGVEVRLQDDAGIERDGKRDQWQWMSLEGQYLNPPTWKFTHWRHKAEDKPAQTDLPGLPPEDDKCVVCHDRIGIVSTNIGKMCFDCHDAARAQNRQPAPPPDASKVTPEEEFRAMIENWDPLTSDERKSINDYFWSHFPPPPAAHLPTVSAVTDEAVVDDEIVDAWRNSLTTKEAVNKLRHIFARDTEAARWKEAFGNLTTEYGEAMAELAALKLEADQTQDRHAMARPLNLGPCRQHPRTDTLLERPHDSPQTLMEKLIVLCETLEHEAGDAYLATVEMPSDDEILYARNHAETADELRAIFSSAIARLKGKAEQQKEQTEYANTGWREAQAEAATWKEEALDNGKAAVRLDIELTAARAQIGNLTTEYGEAMAELAALKSAPKDWPTVNQACEIFRVGSHLQFGIGTEDRYGVEALLRRLTTSHNAAMAEKDAEIARITTGYADACEGIMWKDQKLTEAGKLIAEAGGALSHALLIKHDSHCQYCYDADSVRYKLQAWEGRK